MKAAAFNIVFLIGAVAVMFVLVMFTSDEIEEDS